LRGPFLFSENAMKRRRRVTHARLCELLDYDDQTGEFRWLKQTSPRVRVGQIAGMRNRDGYRFIAIDGRIYPAHRLVWLYKTGKWRSGMIDHRDGDPSNNHWDNLRPATQSQNCANRRVPRHNTCGLKGVSQHRGRWCASICKKGRKYFLGCYSTPQEAHAAYAKAAHKLFGEFARTE
jgi:HNH endonuclease/AP2 domain